MRPRDWLILAILLGAAIFFGWDRLRDTPWARYFAGECAWGSHGNLATGRDLPHCRVAPLRRDPP